MKLYRMKRVIESLFDLTKETVKLKIIGSNYQLINKTIWFKTIFILVLNLNTNSLAPRRLVYKEITL